MKMSLKHKERTAKILSNLNKFGVLDVEMLQFLRIGLEGTTKRNVLRVMQDLENKGYVTSIRKDRKLFLLEGRKYGHLEHRLMMNKFIIKNGYSGLVKIEPSVKVNGIEFRPDFMIPKNGKPKGATDWKFFEVDRTQKKSVNMQKVKRYKDLGLQFEIVCSVERTYMWKGYVYHVV